MSVLGLVVPPDLCAAQRWTRRRGPDLLAMNWSPVAVGADHEASGRLNMSAASAAAPAAAPAPYGRDRTAGGGLESSPTYESACGPRVTCAGTPLATQHIVGWLAILLTVAVRADTSTVQAGRGAVSATTTSGRDVHVDAVMTGTGAARRPPVDADVRQQRSDARREYKVGPRSTL
jgi:hypothetical protein